MIRFLTALVLITASASWADQCEVVTKAQAAKAMKILKEGTEYFTLCEPCGDTQVSPQHKVTTVTTEPFDSTKNVTITLNGEGVDLAYLYVRTTGPKFQNVAKLVRCHATGVTSAIDPTKPVPAAKN